jgi:hypothetical protein
VRRLFGMIMIMLVLAVGTLSPAAFASVRRPASPAPDQFGVRLVDVPVDEANNPRALRYIVDYLPTGTVIHRRILILNQEPKTAHFTVYVDAAQIANGLFTGAVGATRNELTGWMSVQHPSVTLRPGASVTDLVTIKVPQGATRGEHYAVIWVQQAAYVHAATGFGVNDVARVGIRVYLAVGRGGAPPTKFAITSITARRTAAGWPSIVAHVDNTGGRAVDLTGTLRLTGGPGSTAAGPFRSQQILTLAPGQSGNLTFGPPKALPNGRWHASITVVSGLTTATLTASVQFAALVAHPGLSMLAWAGIAVAALAALVAVMALVLARRATRRRRAPA